MTSIDARDVFFTLEVPIVAQRLKLAINGGVLDPFNRLCWEALLMGCILTDSGNTLMLPIYKAFVLVSFNTTMIRLPYKHYPCKSHIR